MPCSQMSYKDREGLLPFPSFFSAPKPKMLLERILGVSPTCSFLPKWENSLFFPKMSQWAQHLSASQNVLAVTLSHLRSPMINFFQGWALGNTILLPCDLLFFFLTRVYCSDTVAFFSLFTRELRVVSPPWLMYMLVYTPSLPSLFPSSTNHFFSPPWFF